MGQASAGRGVERLDATCIITKMDVEGASASKAGSALSSRARVALDTSTALVAASLALAALGGGSAVGLDALLIGSSGASAVSTATAIAALVAATAAAGSAWVYRGGHGAGDGCAESFSKAGSNWFTAAEPLMTKQDGGIDSSRSTEYAETTVRTESSTETEEAITEEVAKPLKRRDPFKGNRQRLILAARERTASWVALLIRGFDVTADGERVEMKLQNPRWSKLMVGDQVFPLVSMGLRLESEFLQLVSSGDDGVSLGELDGERVVTIELDKSEWCLELAVALKALRAEADTGAGIGAWGDRPADHLKRPPPAE